MTSTTLEGITIHTTIRNESSCLIGGCLESSRTLQAPIANIDERSTHTRGKFQ